VSEVSREQVSRFFTWKHFTQRPVDTSDRAADTLDYLLVVSKVNRELNLIESVADFVIHLRNGFELLDNLVMTGTCRQHQFEQYCRKHH
jgi:hypothetical protein